jgi:hypothetical protein
MESRPSPAQTNKSSIAIFDLTAGKVGRSFRQLEAKVTNKVTLRDWLFDSLGGIIAPFKQSNDWDIRARDC